MELIDSERTIADVPVAYETDVWDTAELCGVSTRTLLRYERRGLPSVGRGKAKRYLWPHTAMWVRSWELRQRTGDSPREITMDEALARHFEFAAAASFRAAGVPP